MKAVTYTIITIFIVISAIFSFFFIPIWLGSAAAEKEWKVYENNNFPESLYEKYSAKGYLTAAEIKQIEQDGAEWIPKKTEARDKIIHNHIDKYRSYSLIYFALFSPKALPDIPTTSPKSLVMAKINLSLIKSSPNEFISEALIKSDSL